MQRIFYQFALPVLFPPGLLIDTVDVLTGTSIWKPGMFSQNISLQSVALGLAIVMVGTFKEVRKALKVEEQIKPLYIIPIGTPA